MIFSILVISCKAQISSQSNRDSSPFELDLEAEVKNKSADINNNLSTLQGENKNEQASRLNSQLVHLWKLL